MRVTVIAGHQRHRASPRLVFEAMRRRLVELVDANVVRVKGHRTWREVKRMVSPDDGQKKRPTRTLGVPWMYPLADQRSSVGRVRHPGDEPVDRENDAA